MGYGQTPYGTGSYGNIAVYLPEAHPPLGGYGGALYGLDSYGSALDAPIVIPVSGGYGGQPYGLGPYGSVDSFTTNLSVLSVRSLSGFILEIQFSHEMMVDAALLNPLSYSFTPLFGAAPAVADSVALGSMGVVGPTSVLVSHTGTTLGGLYRITVSGPKDIGGTSIEAFAPLNQAEELCKGEPPPFTITPLSAFELLLSFERPLATEAVFSPGVEALDAWAVSTPYPQTILVNSITHPYQGDSAKVLLGIMGQTTVDYTLTVGPALVLAYDGTYLPSEGDWKSQEIGKGTATPSAEGLQLSCDIGFSYGFRFGDTSGKLQANSAIRSRMVVDLSAVPPGPNGTIFLSVVSDGTVGVQIAVRRVAGTTILVCSSGGFLFEVPVLLSVPLSFELVRNQLANTYTLLINSEPVVSALTSDFTGGAGIPSGIQFLISPDGAFSLENVKVREVHITSSQTIYSEAWNLIHDLQEQFMGLGDETKSTLLTGKGPLVKNWGDATPATKQDVQVTINDLPVEVVDVNPYYGEITLGIPIPLLPPGILSVKVFYHWFPNPVLEMLGLNIKGLVLNQFDNAPLCGLGSSSGVGLPGGGFDALTRFPMSTVLVPMIPLPQPLLRSPRFVAFDKPYTAAIGSPATLLLNRDPTPVALPEKSTIATGEVVFYEGSVPPTEDGWSLIGNPDDDLGDIVNPLPAGVIPNAADFGFFQVLKTTSGPFGVGDVELYTRPIRISAPETILVVVRTQPRTEQLVPHGVFTGVGFGTHTNDHLYLVGFLQVQGVLHLGMLVKPSYPELASSWSLAFSVKASAQNQSTLVFEDLPSLAYERFIAGHSVRFQILEGPQTGVYQITGLSTLGPAEWFVEVNPPLPADVSIWGNREIVAVFETPWTENPTTYRLVVQHDPKNIPQGKAQLFVGGALTGLALTLEGAPPFATPPDGILLYPTGTAGEVFWGSLDRNASNLADWYFVRYAVEPAAQTLHFRGRVVAAEMAALPEEDPNNIWFQTQRFGWSFIDGTGERMVLQKWDAGELDYTFGYARYEPFFTSPLFLDMDLHFSVEIGGLGAGDLLALVDDGRREIRFATLLYEEAGIRQLLTLPRVALVGILAPSIETGWTVTGTVGFTVEGDRLLASKDLGDTFQVTRTLPAWPTAPGRLFTVVLEAASGPGMVFGISVLSRGVGIRLAANNALELVSLQDGAIVASAAAIWEDGKRHSLLAQVNAGADAVTITWDDQVLTTVAFGSFGPMTSDLVVWKNESTAASTLTLWSFSAMDLPPDSAKRTLGIYLGGDVEDIRSWEIPRTDSLSVPNTDLAAAVEEMDWRAPMRVLLHRDPSWGVTMIRPDLPPPPYFDGAFGSLNTQPSAGWINVEYPNLPPSTRKQGWIAFGALDPRAVTQHRYREVRYRIYQYVSENLRSPHHMVLNQYNVITSGEFSGDVTVESGSVDSTDSQTISLAALSVHVNRVFQFSFVNSAGKTVIYLPGSFTFDEATQTIHIISEQTLGYYPSADIPDPEDPFVQNPSLNDPTGFVFPPGDLLNPEFVADEFGYPLHTQVPVTVQYMVGPPLTKTYLCKQPLLDGTTLLFEGTPTYTKSLVGKDEGQIAFGSAINDPSDTLNNDPDFFLNDPYLFMNFEATKGIAYESISFCEPSDGQKCLLSPICDDFVPGASQAGAGWNEPGDIGNGWIGLGLSGFAFSEIEGFSLNDGDGGQGQDEPSMFLEASGGDEDEGGDLQGAILFNGLDLQNPVPPIEGGVVGQLVDLGLGTVAILYFGVQA